MSKESEFYIFSDCETTGFDPVRNDMISVSLIVTDSNHNIIDKYYDEIKPDFNKFYSEEAEKIHGFTKRDMKNFKPRKEACIDMLKFLKPFKDKNNTPRPFVFHALRNFDYQFLNWAFRKEELQYSLWKIIEGGNIFSTIEMARKAGYKDNKLNTWAKRLGVDFSHHLAEDDAKMCLNLYKHLIKETGNDIFTDKKMPAMRF